MASKVAFCARFGQSVWRDGCFGIVQVKEKAGSETSLTEDRSVARSGGV